MSRKTSYRQIGEGFDRAAPAYDLEVEGNPAMRYMREVSLSTLLTHFAPGQCVLEIGCGTGQEAVRLGHRGVYVLATDVSQGMVDTAARKVQAAGLIDQVHTLRLPAGELGALVNQYGANVFDGAYSSFGPLNGEADLGPVSDALATLIRPGGILVASVMNRFYPFETLWYLVHGQLRQSIRRWDGRAMAPVSRSQQVTVPTWYHTPWTFGRAFTPAFRPLYCRALPLLLPPPYLSHLWTRWPWLFDRLVRWEEWLAGRWLLNALGDHFVMVLHRVEG
jgi:SAM-dependent methyltransferase